MPDPVQNGNAPSEPEPSDSLSPEEMEAIERLSGPAPREAPREPEAAPQPDGMPPPGPQLGPDGQPLQTQEKPPEPQGPQKRAFKINGKQVELADAEIQQQLNRIHYGERAEERMRRATELEKVLTAKEEALQGVVEQMIEDPMQTMFDAFVGRYSDYGQAEEALLQKVKEWIRPHIAASAWPEDRRRAWNEDRRKSWELTRKEREIQAREAALQAQAAQGQAAELTTREREFNQKVIERLETAGIPNNWLMASIYNECKTRYEAAGVKWTPLLAAEVVKRHWHKAGEMLKTESPAVAALRRASQSPGQGHAAEPQAPQPPRQKRRASMQEVFKV